MRVRKFWLDANVFIQAKDGLFSFEIAGPFWSFLDEQAKAGRIRSSLKIYKEILTKEHSEDDLAKWIKPRKTGKLFVDPAKHKNVQEHYSKIADYVMNKYEVNQAEIADFTR